MKFLILAWVLCVAWARGGESKTLVFISRGDSFVRTVAHSRASMHSVPEQYDAVRSQTTYLIHPLEKALGTDKTLVYLESTHPHLDSVLKTWFAPYKTHALLADDLEATVALHLNEIAGVVCVRSNIIIPPKVGHFIEEMSNSENIAWAEMGILYLPGSVVEANTSFLQFHGLDLLKLQNTFGTENVTVITP